MRRYHLEEGGERVPGTKAKRERERERGDKVRQSTAGGN